MWARERARLTAVARGEAAADAYVRGGALLNVYTGEIYPANVAIAGQRIAYVGRSEDMVGPRTAIVDAVGRVLVPGYIEPHAHPWVLTTPTALARHVLPLGTTAIVGDNLIPYRLGGIRGFERAAAALARGPLAYYWMIRVHGQSRGEDDDAQFPRPAVRRMLARAWAIGVGEVTRWPDVWAGRRRLLERLALAAEARKRIEGHTAGAGPRRLAALAAAGLSSDHEPINGAEALERARHGIALMLRHSSLRPDLRTLLGTFVRSSALSRLMLTTDGSTPAFIAEQGFVDALVRICLEEGVPPIDAYRMATLNPATYYGMDAELGGIAPGRRADILLLPSLTEPTPAAVIARGRLVARDGRLVARVPEPAWARMLSSRAARFDGRLRATADAFALPDGPLPIIRLASAVITTMEERRTAEGDLTAALLDRGGAWRTTGAVAGFATALDALATTLSTDFHVLVLGRRPAAMAHAVNRLVDIGGGIVVVEGDRVLFELPLPVAGLMSRQPLTEVAERERELQALLRARGHPFHDPLYTLLFMTADFLPAARLTSLGVWDVRRGRVLRPSIRSGPGPRSRTRSPG